MREFFVADWGVNARALVVDAAVTFPIDERNVPALC